MQSFWPERSKRQTARTAAFELGPRSPFQDLIWGAVLGSEPLGHRLGSPEPGLVVLGSMWHLWVSAGLCYSGLPGSQGAGFAVVGLIRA